MVWWSLFVKNLIILGFFLKKEQVSEYFLILLWGDQAKMLGLERLVFRQYRGSIENGANELEDHGDSVHRGSEKIGWIWESHGYSIGFEDLSGNGTPLQYSCLENPMEGGAW